MDTAYTWRVKAAGLSTLLNRPEIHARKSDRDGASA